MANKRIDEATGTETVGHEWDGIEELDTPMPRWWLWTFYATIFWALVYVILYPAWPLIEKGTEGVLGWTSRGELAQDLALEGERKAPILAALAHVPIERLPADSVRMRAAIAGGRAAFKVNCVQCHGDGAAGFKGYPNLNDDDWLWGGDLKAIEQTLLHGIRQPGDDATHASLMPAFGRDGIFTPQQIDQVAGHVLSFTGKARSTAEGAQLYADNCAACHGPAGEGNRLFGAPKLADAIWLYGGSRAEVEQQISAPRHGVMPSWQGRLDPVTIKMLAAYVHSLGGGEDFVDNAAEAEAPDAQP
ncbi:cytochrome-c oxidase, cbb3-type subunit III [Altererythrobacter xixiisoli]|uniref:Cbb3-type cytochrome c oxidase subunit n=1 Tax=Croceibacterium xixiisoli TaxID=1476466 RepID=A0A6I4TS46_9SPHN|nr:cytochrome-c oxidase, cbb3-type subunit III [Croceibacterium xixiisoli]MXO97951.1 cytochrome-c oxidase, cbb3-type subunit III [Croceibacterium xixiisoli]